MTERNYQLKKRDEHMPLIAVARVEKGQILVDRESILFTPTAGGSIDHVQLLAEKVNGGWRPFFPHATLTSGEYLKVPSDGFLSNVLRGILGYPSEKFMQGAGSETLVGFVKNLEEYAGVREDEMARVRQILNTISASIGKI
jgi:hypothetical protein